MHVVHLSPTHWIPGEAIGGGERFVEQLSRAMARRPEVTSVKLVTFAARASRSREASGLERVVLSSWTRDPMTPFSPRQLSALRGADVIHCHQYFVLPTFLAALQGRLQGSRVFVTDLGGGGWTPGYQLDQSRWITAHLPLSRYAARSLPGRNRRHAVILGGVDLDRFPMRRAAEHDGSVVFLGRILPHKGIHVAIAGLPEGMTLHVIGPASDPTYLARLHELAGGRDVRFHHGLSDEEVVAFLQRAMALVHPTPVDASGSAGANELFGLALVEAMACGCPVVASAAASLPEIVEDGRSGRLVPPAAPEAIASTLRELRAAGSAWAEMSSCARARASELSWDHVAARCLTAYRTHPADVELAA